MERMEKCGNQVKSMNPTEYMEPVKIGVLDTIILRIKR